MFGGAELGYAHRWYGDGLAGARIPSHTSSAGLGGENAETSNRDLAALLQGADDRIDDCIDDFLGLNLGATELCVDCVYNCYLIHCS